MLWRRFTSDFSGERVRVTLQDLITSLSRFWAIRGCLIQQPLAVEVGAGTMHPETFLRVLGPHQWRVAYVQPSRRPADGRFGENPNRLFKHHQFQVILKPAPDAVQGLYLDSLRACGIDPAKHDVRFEEDNWESPTLGAWGIGWQVLLDGMEITQFTYFQQAGGQDLMPISVELTYGLERIASFLNDTDSVFNLEWNNQYSYKDLRKREEYEFSKYSFDVANKDALFEMFNLFEKECQRALAASCVLPAYDYCLKCSHTFNLLDCRGAISVTERVDLITRVRCLAVSVAEGYLEETT